MYYLLYTSLLLTLVTSVYCNLTAICGKLCECDDDGRIDCSKSKIKIMPLPDVWPINAKYLDLSWNYIEKIDVEMTHDQLLSLVLNDNKIHSVNLSVFGGLQNLKYLDLSYNNIEEIEKQTFYGLERLEVLNISHNAIKKLPQAAFYNLLDIEELVLSSNPFVFLEKAHFVENIRLKKIVAANIGAYNFNFDVFSHSLSLEYLDLSENQFHRVPTEALRSAKYLKWLQLDLNPIESLSLDSFRKLESLEYLYIRRMPELKTVGAKTFSDLINLKLLEMKTNKKLSYIDRDAFDGLFNDSTSNLKSIDLEMNALSTLGKLPCKHLDKLNLQTNPWICDCSLRWIRRCYFKEIYQANLRCQEPLNFRDKHLIEIDEKDFVCFLQEAAIMEMRHHNRVVRALSLAFTCMVMLAVGAIIIFVIKFKSIRNWYQTKRRGQGAVYYVRAKSYPTEYR